MLVQTQGIGQEWESGTCSLALCSRRMVVGVWYMSSVVKRVVDGGFDVKGRV